MAEPHETQGCRAVNALARQRRAEPGAMTAPSIARDDEGFLGRLRMRVRRTDASGREGVAGPRAR